MKNLAFRLLLIFWLSLGSIFSFAQNIGINTSGTTANSSALLDLNTGNTYTSPNGKGVLLPNVPLSSAIDATTISTPATSLMVYVPSGSGLTPAGYYYNSGTPASPVWTEVINGTNSGSALDHCTTLTNNTVTGFATITLPSNSECGGLVDLCIYATNGTDYQSQTETVHFAAVNKGGTYTTNTNAEGDSRATATSSGSITTSYSMTSGVNSVTIKINADSNLAGLSSIKICYVIFEYSGKTVTEL